MMCLWNNQGYPWICDWFGLLWDYWNNQVYMWYLNFFIENYCVWFALRFIFWSALYYFNLEPSLLLSPLLHFFPSSLGWPLRRPCARRPPPSLSFLSPLPRPGALALSRWGALGSLASNKVAGRSCWSPFLPRRRSFGSADLDRARLLSLCASLRRHSSLCALWSSVISSSDLRGRKVLQICVLPDQ